MEIKKIIAELVTKGLPLTLWLGRFELDSSGNERFDSTTRCVLLDHQLVIDSTGWKR